MWTNDPNTAGAAGGCIRQAGGQKQMRCWFDPTGDTGSVHTTTYTSLRPGDLVMIRAGNSEKLSPLMTNYCSAVYETPGQFFGVCTEALSATLYPNGKWTWVIVEGDADVYVHIGSGDTVSALEYVRALIDKTADLLVGDASDAASATLNANCAAMESTATTSTTATLGQLVEAASAAGTAVTGNMERLRVRLFGGPIDPAAR